MSKTSPLETTTLYLAIGPQQLAALARADYRRIEPGEGGELLILFKLHQRYAEMVARQRILPRDGLAYVLELQVASEAMLDFELGTVAYREHLEYLVPVAALELINRFLTGPVRLVSRFRPGESFSVPALSDEVLVPGVMA